MPLSIPYNIVKWRRYLANASSGDSPYYPVGADCLLYHAYWDGTAVDHSSYGNDGTVVGGATFVDNGLSFDGVDGQVSIANYAALSPRTGDWTAHFWINNTSWPAGSCILYGYTSNPSHGYLYRGVGYLSSLFVGSTVNIYNVNGGYPAAGVWLLSTYVMDRDVGAHIYLNGVWDRTEGNLEGYDILFTQLSFGVGIYFAYFWAGIIGEALIFNDAQNVTQIANYYNATKSRYGL